MANITRIKAKDPGAKQPESIPKPPETVPKSTNSDTKITKITKNSDAKTPKRPEKAEKASKKSLKKPKSAPVRFITWPFRYVHESWLELRQVRWPSRKAAWKMVLAVLIYTALFITIIMLLDALFTLIFNQLLS